MKQRIAYKFFETSADMPIVALERELNSFLAKNHIINVTKIPPGLGNEGRWSFCVEYLDSDGNEAEKGANGRSKSSNDEKIDYRNVLSPEDFALYVKLRSYRKQQSETIGFPAYTICTNAELAEIAKRRPRTKRELLEISGIGEGKWEKYGTALLELVKEWLREHEQFEDVETNSDENDELSQGSGDKSEPRADEEE